MATITSPTYDPTSTAQALAQKYTAANQDSLTAQTKAASATSGGLASLGSAISAFQSSLYALTGLNKTMSAQAATFSDTAMGSATASANAVAGTYSFFVERLASAHQISYSGIQGDAGGKFTLNAGSTAISISIAAGATPRDLAAAINAAPANAGLVTASVISTPDAAGTPIYELVLTAKNTGDANKITLTNDATTPAGWLAGKTANQLVPGQDALIHVGSATGTPISQPTNTFNVIDGVKMTFTSTSTAPVTLTVGADSSATQKNAQAFIDAYNKLRGSLDTLVAAGDPSRGVASGVFAHDAGIRALRERLVSLLHPAGGASLAAYGILAAKDGTLSLKADILNKKLASDPTGLDTLVGSTASAAPSGIAGALDTFLKGWNNSVSGQIKKRSAANDDLQKTLVDRQARLDTQYNAAYQRYLQQFTQLQKLQGAMQGNSSMFDALFSSSKSN